MTEHETSRTLVKSPPELWAECSDAASLARHLGEFGEIKITRLEPETAVAWEGERGSGTVRIEPSAWGTKVTLTAQLAQEAATAEPEPEAVPEPVREPEPEPVAPPSPPPPIVPMGVAPARRGLLARWLERRRSAPPPVAVAPAPPPPPVPAKPAPPAPAAVVPEPEPEVATPRLDPAAALTAALDSLGQAHHRPFSRG